MVTRPEVARGEVQWLDGSEPNDLVERRPQGVEMEKDSIEWKVHADAELKKAFPKAQGGENAIYDGGKFQYRAHTRRWHFMGWLEGEDPKKTIVDPTQ